MLPVLHCFRAPPLLLALLASAPLHAQGAAPADTLTGRVLDPTGRAIASATVRATDEVGRTLQTRSDRAGRYWLVMAGSSRYVLTASAASYAAANALVERGRGGQIEQDLSLGYVQLDALKVQARRQQVKPASQRETPGQSESGRTAQLLEKYPTVPGDLAGVAALAPGIARLDGSDAGAGGLSLAGQAPSQNGTLVDGASFGGTSLPAEAVRRTGVVTSSFDVARGQFSGAQVAATTRSGTNLWGGALSTRLHDPTLRYGDLPGTGMAQRARLLQVDGGGGGPLVRNRLFIYGAGQLSRRAYPVSFLETSDAGSLRRLGLSSDSASRLLDVGRALGISTADRIPREASTTNGLALLRLDYTLSDAHSLTMRLDGRHTEAAALGASPLALAGSSGRNESENGGALLQLTSSFSSFANELRVYRAGGTQRASSDLLLPAGFVRIGSALEETGTGWATLRFGGNPALATRTRQDLLELNDQVTVELRDGKHRITFGVQLQEETTVLGGKPNTLGSFSFQSLADLEAGLASSFTRTLTAVRPTATQRYAAAYLGDVWVARPGLGLVYGVRAEGYAYPDRPRMDTAAAAFSGQSAGAPPSSWSVSPRLGFRLIPSQQSSIDGGIGMFLGRLPLPGMASALYETGTASTELHCVGPAAPTPEWAAYAADPGRIPSTCASGAPLFSDTRAKVALFAPEFRVPRTWRASLGGGIRLLNRWSLRADALVVRGLALPSARERNLAGAGFTLGEEAGRPVFASPSAIDPLSGGVAPGATRLDPALGSVRELGSDGRSWASQLTLGAHGATHSMGTFGVYYTYTRAWDEVGGIPTLTGSVASTAADPNRREWATGDFEQRHRLQGQYTRRLTRRASLSALASLTSGRPFTPLVGGDINGDGYANDRAYIFDPRTAADTSLARGMERLLASGPTHTRSCLRAQLGQVAGRSSCRTPWTPSLDAQLLIEPFDAHRKLQISVIAANVTAGLDYLLHGPDRLRGWGQYPMVDPVLLQVRGFDPAARAYRYQVNPRFGELLSTRGGLRTPFTLTLQARITVGADPAYQQFVAALNSALQNDRSPERLRPLIAARLVNVPLQVLSQNGPRQLELTPAQYERLAQAADSLTPQLAMVVDSLVVLRAGSIAETPGRAARMEELSRRGRELIETGLHVARDVLSPEQWAKLPTTITEPALNEPIVPAIELRFSSDALR
jgi:hypothetical protein